MKKIFSIAAMALLICTPLLAQEKSIVLVNALSMIDTPYDANTLESEDGTEELVVNCEEVDCTTFVEDALAMALCEKQGREMSEAEFGRNLQKIRYRDGKIDGYTSRLHYMSDWVNNGIKNGFLEDVTASPYTDELNLSYMSKNPKNYKQLANSSANVDKMKAIEKSLTGKVVNWVPKDKVPHSGLPYIQNGDIILITTNTAGLDVAHMGLAIYVGNSLCLLHASSDKEKVLVEPMTLRCYLAQNEKFAGIRVMRLKK